MNQHHSLLWRTSTAACGVLKAGLVAIVLVLPAAAAEKPPPPPPHQKIYDPDPEICKTSALQSTFQQQLLPWADQPATVQARLRELQLEMLRATLKRCVDKGLMSTEQATAIARELGQAGANPIQPSGARP